MITEDYVSFETAKLLKEKGFDEGCRAHYGSAGSFSYEKYEVESSECEIHNAILAPTLQMAMKWLREVHNIHIVPYFEIDSTYSFIIYVISKAESTIKIVGFEIDENYYWNKLEEACETAIKYCLENLI